ncbi:MAG: universal stress protein UspE [Oleispira antarctica]|uniref:UspA domain protein n=1 Tax=Oleispira antarctica RB-8 TaxID=698738 RepID=R4YRZ6_OLEAN|nr:universal stress protein UspE [Oleispira antarctica]MBQ0791260.1 universal stress protein UspE [Oleispira antarctica]CCK76013.1 UspA domain protein [Oleispira antarctica RB-8]|tara:strand:- start:4287 stop:5213 length:927 start_codon:yes stop_codon:yes gene_type:complete
MLDINHILVVLDSDHPEQPAFDRALALASSVKADITILGSCYEAYCEESSSLELETKNKIKNALINNRQLWLDTFVDEAEKQGIEISTEVHWQKNLHNAVMASMNTSDFDLVIKGTKPHSIVDRIFTHSDWNLLRHCQAPVLLVKSSKPWANNRILASIDATSHDESHKLINENILDFAEHLADHFKTDLHLVNSYPMVALAFAMVPEVTAPDDIQKYITEQHKTECEYYAKKYNINDDHIHITEGDPDDVVEVMAKEIEADLVVIGSVAREGWSGVLLGNTAERIVDRVSCDVLVIKPLDGVKPDVN